VVVAAGKEMQRDKYQAKEGEKQEQEWKEGRKAKGSRVLLLPVLFIL